MRTRIKFCGMTREEDVALAAQLGVDAIGLIFAARSPRRIDAARGRALRETGDPLMHSVALFMDNEIAEVARVISIVKPTLLQFHGAETAADCERHGLPYLKAIPMTAPGDYDDLVAQHPRAAGFVLDGHAPGEAGGRGAPFDWTRMPRGTGQRLHLLAGGLTPDNVAEAIAIARPHAVDVSSGIESAPGIKDAERMRRFVEAVRRADTSL